MTEQELIELLQADPLIDQLLTIIEAIESPSLYISAGTIRNFVWDYLGEKAQRHQTDVDVIFFDKSISYEDTCLLEKQLKAEAPQFDWEVKNQVYMHIHNPGAAPYASLEEALARFPETCTAIALRRHRGQGELIAPYGITDLVQRIVRPTPYFAEKREGLEIYRQRVTRKNWQTIWPELSIKQLK